MRTPDELIHATQQLAQQMTQVSQQIAYDSQTMLTAAKDIKSVLRQHAEFLDSWLERLEEALKHDTR